MRACPPKQKLIRLPTLGGGALTTFYNFCTRKYSPRSFRLIQFFMLRLKLKHDKGGSPGLVGDYNHLRVLKVVGLNTGTIYWTDLCSHIFVVKIVKMFG